MKVTHRLYPLKISFHTLGSSESPRWPPLNGLLNIFLLLSAAGRLPRDGNPVVADSGLEHRDIAVQPGSVPRIWEVVWPRHELRPPPGIPAGELRDTGTGLVERKGGDEANWGGGSSRAWQRLNHPASYANVTKALDQETHRSCAELSI